MTIQITESVPAELANPAAFYDSGLTLLENMRQRHDAHIKTKSANGQTDGEEEDDDELQYFDLSDLELEVYYRFVREMMDDFTLTQAVVFALAMRGAISAGVKRSGGDSMQRMQALRNAVNKASKTI